MVPDPFTIRLIHQDIVREALERHGPVHLLREPERRPLPTPVQAITMLLSRVAGRLRVAPRDRDAVCVCSSGVGTRDDTLPYLAGTRSGAPCRC